MSRDTIQPEQPAVKQVFADRSSVGDSVFKIGDLMFAAKKDTRFELLKKGQKPSGNTKGDTLYKDDKKVLLGNQDDLAGPGVFRRSILRSKFSDFPAEELYKGALAKPDFSSDPEAKYYITRIKQVCREEGVNFAGHYTVVSWGCGLMCEQIAIVDRINGNIFYSKIPFDTLDGHYGIEFRADSRMLLVNSGTLSENWDYEPGYISSNYYRLPAVYEMKEGSILFVE